MAPTSLCKRSRRIRWLPPNTPDSAARPAALLERVATGPPVARPAIVPRPPVRLNSGSLAEPRYRRLRRPNRPRPGWERLITGSSVPASGIVPRPTVRANYDSPLPLLTATRIRPRSPPTTVYTPMNSPIPQSPKWSGTDAKPTTAPKTAPQMAKSIGPRRMTCERRIGASTPDQPAIEKLSSLVTGSLLPSPGIVPRPPVRLNYKRRLTDACSLLRRRPTIPRAGQTTATQASGRESGDGVSPVVLPGLIHLWLILP
jgi:hypothetical protein